MATLGNPAALVLSLEKSSTCLLPLFSVDLDFPSLFYKNSIKSSHQQLSHLPLHRSLEKIYFHLTVRSRSVALRQPCPYVTGEVTKVVWLFLGNDLVL